MSSGSLENEDLVNVALVRMEDVQPSRDRALNSRSSSKDDNEVYETCIIDNIEYENECIVNDDDDSNIGSMVSLQSEEVCDDDSSNQELIIPEVLEEVETTDDKDELEILIENEHQDDSIEAYMEDPIEDDLVGDRLETLDESTLEGATVSCLISSGDAEVEHREYHVNPKEYILHAPLKTQIPDEVEVPPNNVKRVDHIVITPPTESWPTLEILPGGVIKNTEKYETDSYLYPDKVQQKVANTGEMMYACAKCSQTFKYLFCLVKHVKWHEDQTKVMKDPKLGRMTALEKDLLNIKRERNVLDKVYKKQKIEVLSRVGVAIENSSSNHYICLHSGKKKIVEAERNKRKSSKRLKS